MKNKILAFVLFMLGMASAVSAQNTIDEVVAVVGNEVVLKSDIEASLLSVKDIAAEEARTGQNLRCLVLEQMMQKKLLLYRAKVDSLKVSDEQVQNEMDRKLEVFIQQFGGQDKLEEFYGKSLREIKEEFHDNVKEQLLVDQMQNKITGGVDVTPAEVRKFFNDIPKDSLPYYNAEMEIAQIVIIPKITLEEKLRVRRILEEARQSVREGRTSFATQARAISDDKGSAKMGGRMEMQRASNFVPEFAAASLALRKGEDTIVETKFGLHLVRLIDRRGDLVETEHILKQFYVTMDAEDDARKLLDSIRTRILTDSVFTFERAAYKYSMDTETKNRGGLMVDMKTGSARIPVDELDSKLFFVVDRLKPGEISQIIPFKTSENKDAIRIVMLKSKTPPHMANLNDDYSRIQRIAGESKKAQKMQEWIDKYIPKTYIRVDQNYAGCGMIGRWRKGLGAR